MNLSRNQLIIIGAVLAVIIIVVVIISGFGRRSTQEKAELVFWGIDDQSAFVEGFADFQSANRGITIDYKKIPEADYEQALVDALAAGNGPDVFMFRSSWLGKHGNKVAPFTEEYMTPSRFADLYPQVAEEDFISSDKIYSIPLYIDTLALYYDRDAFDKKGVALPPKTWTELEKMVSLKGVTAALGGYAPLLENAPDIMLALLFQSGADLNVETKSFIQLSSIPGETALSTFLRFKAPKEDAISGFAGGRINILLGYYSSRSLLKAKNPFLNFGVSPLPQLDPNSPVVVADYYGLSVSSKSANKGAAMNLASFLTSDSTAADKYARGANRPPALRSLIERYSDHNEFGVFVKQALIARSWKSPDISQSNSILNEMIKSVLKGSTKENALLKAESDINRLLYTTNK